MKNRRAVISLALVGALLLGWWLVAGRGPKALVVYCAHDSIYSEAILRDFEKQTGIAVAIRFDTEATKSLGLVELLIHEKDAPRCDVFWNNEPLGTADLAQRGMLEPYKGPGFERIPIRFRDEQGRWAGFAARLRVWIYNPAKIEEAAFNNSGAFPWPDGHAERVAIAKPLYGTTLTQYSVLWQLWGPQQLKTWHLQWRRMGVRELNGNAAVKDAVAQGVCDVGLTDTDDFFEALDDGAPVAMRPAQLGGWPLCIPNTVAIIRGTRKLEQARRLADFLLSEATELALARSKSRQIPLGTMHDETQIPEQVRELRPFVKRAVFLGDLGPARDECLAWLKGAYLR